jgi:putative oxidoreductase
VAEPGTPAVHAKPRTEDVLRLGTLFVRTTIGALFVGHGTQKLFGWFGGHGIEGTGGAFESMGLKPGQRHARAAGAAEAGGGLLLTLGLLTPVAATSIIATMVTAIRKVHAKNGPWVTEGGYEYNLVLIGAMVALADNGPGPFSLDARLFPGLKGTPFALLALAAGTAGSFVATSDLVNEADGGPQEGAADLAGDPASANGNVAEGAGAVSS